MAVAWDALLEPTLLFVFVLLQLARIWVILTLGRRWTTRIIVTGEPLVRHGPYRFIPHPNYAVVAGEVAVVPLALGQYGLAVAFSILHLGVLWIRIRAENQALLSHAPTSTAIPNDTH